jgi:C-terminal processing protease CtpA/Prc
MNTGRMPVWVGLLTVLCAAGLAEAQSVAIPSTQPASAAILRASDLQADVALLRRAYTTLHPGLYRYKSPAQIDSAFDALQLEFQHDRTLADAYRAFSVLAGKVQCGHTYLNFYNQSEAVQTALFHAPRVPFYFRWLGNRMIVTRSFATDPRFRAGAEVLTLNGVPVGEILTQLMTVARADGGNDAKRMAYLEVAGTDRYEAFDIYWPLFFPSSAPRVTLRVRDPETHQTRTISVPTLTYADRLAAFTAAEGPAADANAPLWELRQLDDRVGYLRMRSWVLYNSKWNWRQSLAETFATLIARGSTDLVIDLRGNEGGSDVGDVIISHLIAAPVPRQAITRLVRYRKSPDDLAPYLDTWDRSFRDWGSAATDSTDQFYRLRRDADDDPGGVIAPAPPRFSGRLWVLVGASNSSATFEFVQTVRQNQLGTLVGQPTGGNQRGINGGAFFFLRLPRTGLELDLPLIGQFPDGDRPDAGLQPDILIVPTVKDIAQGRDMELEAVRARLRLTAKQPPSPGTSLLQ